MASSPLAGWADAKPDPRENVNIRLRPSSIRVIDEEQRRDGLESRSDMIRVLLAEALAARQERRKR
jgi:Arc/MetJ-type ribon-helix-helix transcriptional regulator